jgi:hypothetical protein
MLSQKKIQGKVLVCELKKGEKSGFVSSFDKGNHLKSVHAKYLKNVDSKIN